jgi:hypothetical protein
MIEVVHHVSTRLVLPGPEDPDDLTPVADSVPLPPVRSSGGGG